MAEFEPIALRVKPQSGVTSLGELLAVGNAATQLQKSRATLESDVEQRKAESRSAVTESELRRRTLEPTVRTSEAHARTAETGANSSQWKLDADQASTFMQHAGGLLTDKGVVDGDSAASMKALMGLEERARALKIPEEKIRAQMAPLYLAASHQPQALAGLIKQGVAGSIAPGSQPGALAPSYAAAGGTAQTNVNQFTPGAQPAPQVIQPAVGITQQEEAATDALGNPAIKVRAPNGAISYKAPPGSNTPPLMALPPGETADTAKPLMALRQATNAAAAAVPEQRSNNQQIVKFAQSGLTGTLSESLRRAAGIVGMDKAADTAQLNHFLAKQTEANAASAGASTDQGRAMAAQVAGTATSPEKAIIGIARVNDAYATATEMRNKGLEAAINHPENGKSIFAARDFQNRWSEVMGNPLSLTAMQLHNAVSAKNNATTAAEKLEAQKFINEITQSVGGKKSNGAAKLAQQYLMIDKLSAEGR